MVAALDNLNRVVTAGGSYKYVVMQGGDLNEIEVEREDLIIPDEDAYRCLEFYGIATETYTVTFEGETTTKINLLLRIIDPNDAQHKGMFRTSVTFESCGPKSTMGQIFSAILGQPFIGAMDDEFWPRVLGGRFSASFTRKEKADATYLNIVHGSPRPAREKASAKPKATAAPNPFDDEE